MRSIMEKLFGLRRSETTVKKEVLAGLVSFFTIVYIVVVNAAILADAGIPVEAGIVATVLTAFVSCLMMGLWGNAPIVLVPGMGINALFSYTIVQSMGLGWREALAAVLLSGVIFAVIACTRLAKVLTEAIPSSLKDAITVGIGLFLTFIGLQKGGLVAANDKTFVALGDLGSPTALLTLATLVITLVLFVRNVRGNFLISIAAGTMLAAMFGQVDFAAVKGFEFSFGGYGEVFAGLSFDSLATLTFWVATFSLTMVIVFENIGLIHGLMPEQPEKFGRALQASSASAIAAGFFGTSPTVAAVESAAGIAAGGKTGLTSITTGVMFLFSLFFIPVIKIIPNSALAPVLLVIGGLMIQQVKNIRLDDFSEGFPAFLIIALIPLTYSIADGIAFGFVAYPILKLALGRAKEVALPLYGIAALFFLNFALHALG